MFYRHRLLIIILGVVILLGAMCLLVDKYDTYQQKLLEYVNMADTETERPVSKKFRGDGRLFDVRGRIKKIKLNNGKEETFNFNKKGRFVSPNHNGCDDYEVVRDTANRIVFTRLVSGIKDVFYTGSFAYDKKNRVTERVAIKTASYASTYYDYRYGDNDEVVSIKKFYTISGSDERSGIYITDPVSFNSSVEYRIVKRDKRGNWTWRQAEGYEYELKTNLSGKDVMPTDLEVGIVVSANGEQHPVYCRKVKINRKETRVLEYYDDKRR